MKTALKESEHILAQLRIEPTVTYLKDQKQAKQEYKMPPEAPNKP